LFALALLGTVFAWILIYVLESRSALRIRVSHLQTDRVEEAVQFWQRTLEELNVPIVSIVPHDARGEIDILLLVSSSIDDAQIRRQIREKIPEELLGRFDAKLA
jgi:hypothetical protein